MVHPMTLPTVKPEINRRDGRRAERAKSSRHDSLHVEISGLSYCWCKCADCWKPSFSVKVKGIVTGFCICSPCPCRRETEAALRTLTVEAKGSRLRVR